MVCSQSADGLGNMRAADLAPRPADLGRSVQHKSPTHARRGAGIDLVEERRAALMRTEEILGQPEVTVTPPIEGGIQT